MASSSDIGRRSGKEPAQPDDDDFINLPFGPTPTSQIPPEPDHRTTNFTKKGKISGLAEPMRTRKHAMQLTWYDEYEPYFKAAELYRAWQIGCGKMYVDPHLITALGERWRKNTHTFLLPFGEMTVTLNDVSYIMGLRIMGDPVCFSTRQNWAEKISELLGVDPDETTFRKGSKTLIKLTWLRAHFNTMNNNQSVDPEQVERHCRAYMLCFFGDVLFPDKSGDSVSAVWLMLLEDMSFEGLRAWNWGGAVLAYLYRQLCDGRKEKAGLGGCVILLQLWSWFHFPIGRPQRARGAEAGVVGGEDRPGLGMRFLNYHSYSKVCPKGFIPNYRDAFDGLTAREVIWRPYESYMPLLPHICYEEEVAAYISQPLFCIWICEMYNPDRVRRQFNQYQIIPAPIMDTDGSHRVSLHSIKNNQGGDWPREFETLLDEAAEATIEEKCTYFDPIAYNPSTEDAYIQWYREFFQPSVQTVIPHDEGRDYRSDISGKLRLVFIYLF
jgi:hypothetical protein